MTEETLKKLLETSKKALKIISVAGKDHEFVFELRDLIRKAESELKTSQTAEFLSTTPGEVK
jgi:hypothetical protein